MCGRFLTQRTGVSVLAIALCLYVACSAPAQTTVYVDGSVAVTGNGSLEAPFKTIDEGLASANRTILIAGGTYRDEPQYNAILSGQTIIGGYDSTFATCDPEATPTVIDMGGVLVENQHGTFVVNGASGWTIENLVIQNSSTGASGDSEHGGGIYVRGGSGTFRNVTFYKCAAIYEDGTGGTARGGGAVAIRNGASVVFEDCVFDSCTGVGGGGAVYYHSGNNYAMYNRCLFTKCGGGTGAAVIRDGGTGSQIEIINCVFAGNGVDVITPAATLPSEYLFVIADLQALVYNCTFVGNNCPAGYMFEFRDSGGGATKEVVNCAFADNTVGGGGSSVAIFSYAVGYDDATIIENNLFFSNSGMDPLDPTGVSIIDVDGNIAGDPQFVDAASGDYHLQAGSPGEDAGQTLALVPDDFTRRPRPVGSAYDIGAFEGQGTRPEVRGIIATASSSVNDDLGPQKTVDGSGLDPWGQHDTTPTNMWLSAAGQEPPVWIQYEFDIVHKLDQMWIWNSNTAFEPIPGLGGLGVKTATIQYSMDGTTWTALADVPEFGQATGTDDYRPDTTVYFDGVAARFVRITCTSNWGGGGQYGLSEVQFFSFPVHARGPDPHDGARGVAIDPTLSWQPGSEAVEHKVYISGDEQSVIDGTAPAVTVSQPSHGPLSLDIGTEYYWRVDSVNSANAVPIWEGRVWSFTTTESPVVDDFESYDDDFENFNRIFQVWRDGVGFSQPVDTPGNGTGSSVGTSAPPWAETVVVHHGSQSMPMEYSNAASPFYSEAERTFDSPQDWTRAGLRALTLYFHGDPGNTADATERLYVKLNGVKEEYDGDMANLQDPSWHVWNIDLASFELAGVDLQNVTTIGLGIGNGASPGGSGLVYFDNIRLYPSRCILSERSAGFAKADFAPVGNPSGDCIVDFREIEIIAQDWLLKDQVIAPTVDPGLTGIHAYYPLNEGQGIVVSDLSGNNPGGGTINNPSGGLGMDDSVWDTDSERGTVLSFSGDDGTGAFVSAGMIPALGLADNFTWAFWAKQADGGTGANDVIIGNRDGGTQSPLQFIKFTPGNFEYYNGGDGMFIDYNDIPNDQWIHHATVKSGTTLTYYRNGAYSGTSTVTLAMNANPFLIGGDVTRERWRGWISEVRLYNRALSQAEIAYLADTSPGDGRLHFPVPSAAELYEAEPEGSRSVDMRDFAILADVWLEQQLWPAW